MRVGVTGGAGYIGSHTVLALINAGHEPVVLDDFSTGSELNLLPGVPLIRGTYRNPDILSQFFSHKLDAVCHFAALKAAGESMQKPLEYAAANIRGSLELIEALCSNNVQHLVFSSSAAVYGEPRYLPIDEKHPEEPVNYYGFTKKCVEENLKWFSRLGRLHFASLRYFNAAGYDRSGKLRGLETKTQNLLPLVMEAAAGKRSGIDVYGSDYPTRDGTCIRDYIHVDDLARAHVLAVEHLGQNQKELIVNLGSEKGLTVLEMLDASRRITGRPIEGRITARRAGDPPELIASSKKAYEILGWKAECSDAETIISSMWELYRQEARG